MPSKFSIHLVIYIRVIWTDCIGGGTVGDQAFNLLLLYSNQSMLLNLPGFPSRGITNACDTTSLDPDLNNLSLLLNIRHLHYTVCADCTVCVCLWWLSWPISALEGAADTSSNNSLPYFKFNILSMIKRSKDSKSFK